MRLAAAVAVLTLLASPAFACGVGSGSRAAPPPAAKKVGKEDAKTIKMAAVKPRPGCILPPIPRGPVS